MRNLECGIRNKKNRLNHWSDETVLLTNWLIHFKLNLSKIKYLNVDEFIEFEFIKCFVFGVWYFAWRVGRYIIFLEYQTRNTKYQAHCYFEVLNLLLTNIELCYYIHQVFGVSYFVFGLKYRAQYRHGWIPNAKTHS